MIEQLRIKVMLYASNLDNPLSNMQIYLVIQETFELFYILCLFINVRIIYVFAEFIVTKQRQNIIWPLLQN